MSLVIDASAAVEFLLRTKVGEQLASVIEQTEVYAPELLDVEVVSVLRKFVFRGDLTESRAAEARQDLASWPYSRISHRDLIEDAWSYRANITIYDSFYVAAAKALDAPLLTTDVKLSRAPLAGVTVQTFTSN